MALEGSTMEAWRRRGDLFPLYRSKLFLQLLPGELALLLWELLLGTEEETMWRPGKVSQGHQVFPIKELNEKGDVKRSVPFSDALQ